MMQHAPLAFRALCLGGVLALVAAACSAGQGPSGSGDAGPSSSGSTEGEGARDESVSSSGGSTSSGGGTSSTSGSTSGSSGSSRSCEGKLYGPCGPSPSFACNDGMVCIISPKTPVCAYPCEHGCKSGETCLEFPKAKYCYPADGVLPACN